MSVYMSNAYVRICGFPINPIGTPLKYNLGSSEWRVIEVHFNGYFKTRFPVRTKSSKHNRCYKSIGVYTINCFRLFHIFFSHYFLYLLCFQSDGHRFEKLLLFGINECLGRKNTLLFTVHPLLLLYRKKICVRLFLGETKSVEFKNEGTVRVFVYLKCALFQCCFDLIF